MNAIMQAVPHIPKTLAKVLLLPFYLRYQKFIRKLLFQLKTFFSSLLTYIFFKIGQHLRGTYANGWQLNEIYYGAESNRRKNESNLQRSMENVINLAQFSPLLITRVTKRIITAQEEFSRMLIVSRMNCAGWKNLIGRVFSPLRNCKMMISK